MPGGRGALASPGWFEEVFGFAEGKYAETKGKFEFSDGVLACPSTGRTFYVGPFESLSRDDLRSRIAELPALPGEEGLKFANIVGDARALHRDHANAGAVFQAASQFNCLEMVGPDVRPQDGITRYASDATQGPACALACPAATLFRNYMVNETGQGTGHQIDCLSAAGELVDNKKEQYWRMANGYAMPCSGSSIGQLSRRIHADAALAESMKGKVQVGIHWDTDVSQRTGSAHRVCQVFCSALPVAYAKGTRSGDWQAFACVVLDAIFDATLAAATVLALRNRSRVKVYLTAVGGGAFGNRSMWITQAIENALKTYESSPLDVMLVHFGAARSAFSALEKGRAKPGSATSPPKRVATETESVKKGEEITLTPDEKNLEDLVRIFAKLDDNGDGVVDYNEFVTALQGVDPDLFTKDVLHRLFTAADSDADGEVHYAEFAAWLVGEDASIASKMLAMLGPVSS